jgi:hypothetical protein
MQTELVKKFVLSWAYYVVDGVARVVIFLSLMPLETLSNDPMAVEMLPLARLRRTSLPLPTVIGLARVSGTDSQRGDARSSRHWLPDRRQTLLRHRTCAMLTGDPRDASAFHRHRLSACCHAFCGWFSAADTALCHFRLGCQWGETLFAGFIARDSRHRPAVFRRLLSGWDSKDTSEGSAAATGNVRHEPLPVTR